VIWQYQGVVPGYPKILIFYRSRVNEHLLEQKIAVYEMLIKIGKLIETF
jgi:hypothetical protein